MVLYARALLLLDHGEFAQAGWTVEHVAAAVGLDERALVRLKERFVNYGLEAALERKKPFAPRGKYFLTARLPPANKTKNQKTNTINQNLPRTSVNTL